MRLLLSILFVVNANLLFAAFPSYMDVVRHFNKNYTVSTGAQYIKFAKKASGWTVYKQDLEDDQKLNDEELLWSAGKQKFLTLKEYPKRNKTEFPSLEESNYIGAEYNFQRSAYYGYPGWADDVIAEFAEAENLSDTLLEGLARAYDTKGGGYLWNQYGYAKREMEYPFLPFNEPISDKRINLFLSYLMKATDIYKKLSEKNPQYETMLGVVEVKYWHELFYIFHTLCMTGHTDKAEELLASYPIYNDAIKNLGYNYFHSLAPGAILFTYGDLDTYICTYLQVKEHFRTDVSIVNVGMLGLPRYTASVSKGTCAQQPVAMQLKPETYLNDTFYYAFYEPREEWISEGNKRSVEQLVDHLNNGTDKFYRNISRPILAVPSKEYYISANGIEDASISYKMKRDYLTAPDMHLLDIIQSNIYSRPLYFSVGTGYEILEPFAQYLWLEGLAYRLGFTSHDGSDLNTYYVHPSLMFTNYMKFHYYDSSDHKADFSKQPLIANTRNIRKAAASLADHFSAKGEKDSAMLVLKKTMEIMPPDGCPCDVFCAVLADSYFKAGDKKQAMDLMMKSVNVFKNQMEDVVQKKDPYPDYAADFIAYCMYIAEFSFEDKALLAELKKVKKQYKL